MNEGRPGGRSDEACDVARNWLLWCFTFRSIVRISVQHRCSNLQQVACSGVAASCPSGCTFMEIWNQSRMRVIGCGSILARRFRHSAPSEMTATLPWSTQPSLLSARSTTAFSSPGRAPSKAKIGSGGPPLPLRPQWQATASRVHPPYCLTTGMCALSTLKTNSLAGSPESASCLLSGNP